MQPEKAVVQNPAIQEISQLPLYEVRDSAISITGSARKVSNDSVTAIRPVALP